MIIRLIVFIVIFFLLWWLYRNIRALINKRSEQVNKTENKESHEEMISCKVCGVYTPKSHAIKGKNNHFYCSEEHYLEDK
ncbi:hypothetical protein MED121_22117 [Marinomonas sp. MED121]|uniref:PP0621 family protein n=1 Tax=Marinomonas sp. MED121 TaxID=314277 RepID=UPI000068FE02|nr:PP0621 family protein [Marinomonas sp. MED121]EAQ65413.1 hypothetical protein MED121_22117 [Marinomonas sp. MED121]